MKVSKGTAPLTQENFKTHFFETNLYNLAVCNTVLCMFLGTKY
jgi:hypothetical protein